MKNQTRSTGFNWRSWHCLSIDFTLYAFCRTWFFDKDQTSQLAVRTQGIWHRLDLLVWRLLRSSLSPLFVWQSWGGTPSWWTAAAGKGLATPCRSSTTQRRYEAHGLFFCNFFLIHPCVSNVLEVHKFLQLKPHETHYRFYWLLSESLVFSVLPIQEFEFSHKPAHLLGALRTALAMAHNS